MIGVYNPHNLRIIYRYCSILLALSQFGLMTLQAIAQKVQMRAASPWHSGH
jgi:hypothetical protein